MKTFSGDITEASRRAQRKEINDRVKAALKRLANKEHLKKELGIKDPKSSTT